MIQLDIRDINSKESESGIIATLIHHPDYYFHSEELLPNHFTVTENACVYGAISNLVKDGIENIDAYNICENINNADNMIQFRDSVTIDMVKQFVDVSGVLCRSSVNEYKMLVSNVLNAAFRRETYNGLKNCEQLCLNLNEGGVEQKIYNTLDNIMMNYCQTSDAPEYKDVVDGYWHEIESRQEGGYAGIPFPFPTLNKYATIERGELFVFAADMKQGKSIMLLNCAMDLLKKDKAVLYVDSELNSRLFTARVLSHLTGIEFLRLTSGNYSEEEHEKINQAIAWMKTRKFCHIYMPIFDENTLYTTVKKVKHTMGLDVLVVDYFKSGGDGDAFNTYQELGRFVDLVKNKIAGKMDIAAIGATQATATGKIADSAKIGRNASTIAIMKSKTPEEIEADGVECGNKKLMVVLNRNGMQNAPGEYIDLNFVGNKILFTEAKQHIPQTPY